MSLGREPPERNTRNNPKTQSWEQFIFPPPRMENLLNHGAMDRVAGGCRLNSRAKFFLDEGGFCVN